MKKYDYKILSYFDCTSNCSEHTLTSLGNNGWDIVSVMPIENSFYVNIILKREMRPMKKE